MKHDILHNKSYIPFISLLFMRKKLLLEKANEEGIALTFDDVRLKTGYSENGPDSVKLDTFFSRNVKLKIPIVSAAMDTVTESKMAISIAKLGGIGVIHKNMSIEEQAKQVAKVKHHLNAMIEKPICVYEDEKIKYILERRKEKGYSFHSFPVLDRLGKLVGIMAETDFQFCDNFEKTAAEVMTKDVCVATPDTKLERAYEIMKQKKKKLLPLVTGDGEIKGLYIFSDVQRVISGSEESFNVDEKGRLRVAAAIGTGRDSLERARRLVEENVDVIVIDKAHGDSNRVISVLKDIKKIYPHVDVVAGNISIGESVRRLAEAGADGIKVGQGPGSICTTRIIAGIGRPQVSAVYDCALVADEYGIPVCADGGITNSGDITIAIGAGASCVMLGSLLAGTDESPGEINYLQGRPWKSYRGMGSLGVMASSKESRDRYGQTEEGEDKIVPEGVEGIVPFKGELKSVVFQYVGGLRRGMAYVGAANIQELREKGEFDRITSSGLAESHPHGIQITKDSPNYKDNRA